MPVFSLDKIRRGDRPSLSVRDTPRGRAAFDLRLKCVCGSQQFYCSRGKLQCAKCGRKRGIRVVGKRTATETLTYSVKPRKKFYGGSNRRKVDTVTAAETQQQHAIEAHVKQKSHGWYGKMKSAFSGMFRRKQS